MLQLHQSLTQITEFFHFVSHEYWFTLLLLCYNNFILYPVYRALLYLLFLLLTFFYFLYCDVRFVVYFSLYINQNRLH